MSVELESVIQTLRDLLPELRQHGVESIGVFGSLARGDARAASDVDIFIRFDPEFRATLATMGRVQELLETRLSASVDLVDDHDRLSQPFRQSVEQDLIRVA